MPKIIRRFIYKTWSLLTGNIYSNGKLTLTRNGWIIISDGISKDALPISLVAQETVDALMIEVEEHLKKWGY